MQKVIIKTWEELTKEFTEIDGRINASENFWFTKEMETLLPEDRTIYLGELNNQKIWAVNGANYTITDEMIAKTIDTFEFVRGKDIKPEFQEMFDDVVEMLEVANSKRTKGAEMTDEELQFEARLCLMTVALEEISDNFIERYEETDKVLHYKEAMPMSMILLKKYPDLVQSAKHVSNIFEL